MNGLLMSLPGSPIIYYGDEIGMGGQRRTSAIATASGRTVQWSAGFNCGFSMADPERLWLPLVSHALYGFQAVNVESQQRNGTSLLKWYVGSSRSGGPHVAFRPKVDSVSDARDEPPGALAFGRGRWDAKRCCRCAPSRARPGRRAPTYGAQLAPFRM